MPKFSPNSKQKLLTCHYDLQRLFNNVIKHRDCTVIFGHRGENEQNEAYRTGNSLLAWPHSTHNKVPSLGIDVMPYYDIEPHIRWEDTMAVYEFSGFVKGIASQMGIVIRHGYDWDMDNDFGDQTFMDGAHYELVLDSE